ncbi:MAG: hypothetical protein IPM83_12920 [Ignavibacteria bacterium]|nr:hypothetical protein [Ignavibacteria bacterium]
MDTLPDNVKRMFYEVLNGDMTIRDFEQLIYDSDKYENALGAGLYLDLISFNYDQKDALTQLKEIIRPFIDSNEFNVWRIKSLLIDIIEDRIDLVVATHKLRDLYYSTGESIIPISLGVGYESELDEVPIPSEYHLWDKNGLSEKLKKVELYRPDIIREAKELLEKLNLISPR